MSDCGVCCYTDYEVAEVFEQSYIKSRKEHKCDECGKKFPKGTKYEHIKMLFEGRWEVYRTCPVCSEIARAFQCDGRVPGALWKGMYEVMDQLTTGCFNRLEIPEAKAELQRRWMDWKGLDS